MKKPLAYSYIRFSTARQIEGDSLRRQTEAAAAWCQRNGVALDTSATLHDLGRSAFKGAHRTNPDRNALAGFLALVESGCVPRGSYLIIEALDRLTREDAVPALSLLLNLIQSGVRVVQLIPAEVVYDEKTSPMLLMLAIAELSRGHSESRAKSERVGAAWAQKKAAARASGRPLSANCPRWIELRDGKLQLIPERAAVVRRIFKLAAGGYGFAGIAKKLAAEGVPSFGEGRRKDGIWTRTYIDLILGDRRALGEYQPMRAGQPDGPLIPNYYPAAITEAEWLAAMAGRKQRVNRGGRTGRNVNPFAGLLRCAQDGSAYHLNSWRTSATNPRSFVLVNQRATEGAAKCRSFPYVPFEAAVLSRLREIDPRDILGTDAEPDRSDVLAGELASIDAKIAELESDLERDGASAAITRVLRKQEQRRAEVAKQLEGERARATSPVADSFGEAQTLAGLLASADDTDEIRTRLRSALRRSVADAWLCVVPRGSARLAWCQFVFVGGASRSFLVAHRPRVVSHGREVRPAQTVCRSVSSGETFIGFPMVDLRTPDRVKRAEAALAAIDLEDLFTEVADVVG